ncbi:MAG TPA: hypothetical protein PK385_06990 [Spirochaetota bacterium]|nr:hypothetical protein [Spirochaetota bacterium]HOS31835.1 hypothetical protein [Spirochaetota bacterium]HOS55789.1 hypothetical protein [Spirochaetota bacterium]HPK61797.1 hypothetical protein [Spirochaetota bacterium]HQF76699.1 hypothetical protein [Spirochaetota bacterium]
MSAKSMDLNLDVSKDVVFKGIKGNIFLNVGERSKIEYNSEKFGNIEPEAELTVDEVNKIILKNSDLATTDVSLTIPKEIKKISIVLDAGNIAVNNCEAYLDITLTKGNAYIEKAPAGLNVSVLDGDIKIDKVIGTASVKAANGAIKIGSFEKSGGNVESENGQILINIESINNSLDVKSKYGKLVLGLNKNVDCSIIARGQDVVSYLTKITGESLGSPSQIKNGDGSKNITAFSATNKVLVAYKEDVDRISPDFDKIFQELDEQLSKDLKKLALKLEGIGEQAIKSGKSFLEKLFSNITDKKGDDSNKDKTNNKDKTDNKTNAANEKMEIISLLKEGKITPEEAEKLLKALK